MIWFHVYPSKPRNTFLRVLHWPLVLAQVLWLHLELGLGYAIQWANASLRGERR